MKGLWKYISPFAPDQSGAAAVLYGLGGIVVICDAGGCAGNICGFDEPRWFSGRKSAVFSAGLRDMDAILGRDDLLVRKVCAAAETVGAAFVALVGTPVPAVIGTDFKALCRMISHKLNIPALSVPTTGIGYYDAGMKAAYEALLPALTQEEPVVEQGRAGVLGRCRWNWLTRANSRLLLKCCNGKAGRRQPSLTAGKTMNRLAGMNGILSYHRPLSKGPTICTNGLVHLMKYAIWDGRCRKMPGMP